MLKLFSAIGAVIALLFFFPLIGVLAGAFGGWVVGLFFTDTVLGTLARLGVNADGLAMWQLGATLGFIGSFFRTSVTKK